jgi:catechol 2,3-dioxygenase-like lactoylglutathione lyase family enzyme
MTTATVLNALGLAPILTVNDLAKSLHFYEGLGFSIEERYEREGKLNGARMVAGQARVNLTQDDWGKGRDRVKGTGMRLFIPVEQEIDALAATVKAAGLALESGPDDNPWGRSFTLTDPDGFRITVARVQH